MLKIKTLLLFLLFTFSISLIFSADQSDDQKKDKLEQYSNFAYSIYMFLSGFMGLLVGVVLILIFTHYNFKNALFFLGLVILVGLIIHYLM